MISYFRSLAGLLLAAGLAHAQTVSTWTGGGGNGNWTNAGNWDVLPTSGANTELVFTGNQQAATIQNAGSPFELTSLTLADTASTNFSISGDPIRFVAGTSGASITTNTLSGRLLINSPLEFATPISITRNVNNAAGGEIFLNGPISGAATVSATTLAPAALIIIGSPNNTGFAGTWTESVGLTMLAAPNALWRTSSVVTGGGIGGIVVGTTTAAGYGYTYQAFNQQVGSISGSGTFQLGSTDVAATALVGFSNADTTLTNVIGVSGYNSNSHFGKVGNGTLTVLGTSSSMQMGLSMRDGALVLSGVNGALNDNGLPTSDHGIYSGGSLRLNNATAINPSISAGRLSDTAKIRLSGGTLRMDGNATTNYTENLGPMRPFAGQSAVVANPRATAFVKFNFASFTPADLARGGQVAFAGGNLGAGTGAGQSGVTFTTAPTLTNDILPWAVAQTNYVSNPSAATNTVEPDTLATYGANGVQPLTSFVANNLTSPTANVLLTNANAPIGAAQANSLTLDPGGSLTLTDPLTLTAGAIFNRSPNGSIDGPGAVTTPGRLYLNSSQNLTVNAPVNAAHLSKGANGTATLNGTVNLGANPLVAVNAGTLAFGPSATVTPSSGNVTYQVSRNATLSNLPGPVTGTLRGNGAVTGPVVIASGGRISASALAGGSADGAAPGVLTLTGPLSLAGGSRVVILVSSQFDGPYTQSFLQGTSLDLTGATAANPIVIEPRSLLLSNEGPGAVYDVTSTDPIALTIGTFPDGIDGFAPEKFTFSTGSFTTPIGTGVTFTIQQSGNSLQAQFRPVPEPSLVLLLLAAPFLRRKDSI